MQLLNVLDLFSGIGGFSYGLERTRGFRTVAFSEINSYCQTHLKRHWPDVPNLGDVRNVTGNALGARGISRIDVVVGGFPCTPFSAAGKKRGIDDDDFLWSPMRDVIEETGPKYVVVENVDRLLSSNNGVAFWGILSDLAEVGYDAEWQVISAADVGAWHLRKRLWIVAYPNGSRREGKECSAGREDLCDVDRDCAARQPGEIALPGTGRDGEVSRDVSDAQSQRRPEDGEHRERPAQWAGGCRQVSDTDGTRCEEWIRCSGAAGGIFAGADLREYRERNRAGVWRTEPAVRRVADGIPNRVDRVAALGRAVVPQIVEFIGDLILAREERIRRLVNHGD